jgi:competence protein ComFC
MILSSIKQTLIDFIFPPHCLVCGKETESENICEDCKRKIKFMEYPLIEHDGRKFFYSITYYEGVMEKIIKKMKFYRLKSLSKDLSNMISNFIYKENISFDAIGYVPMTRKELLERKFNQTYLIAKEISNLYNKPLIKGLKKIKTTRKQVGLSKKEREENLKNVFTIEEKIKGNILLIDDVYTTGSTARELVKSVYRKTEGNIIFVAVSRKMN